jgi:hypothetical protein
MAHTAGIYGAEPGLIVGTRSAHPLSLDRRRRDAPAPATEKADSRLHDPVADFFPTTTACASRPAWTGRADKARRDLQRHQAYKTLMLLGNRSAGLGRRVSVWDRLDVDGSLVLGSDSNLPTGSTGAFWRKGGQAYLGIARTST